MSEPWWKAAVVYQVYPRSFADSNGDGIGDLPGIIGKLDYLHRLGVDVLWLSPFYRSPQDDNGYDISDYQDVDPVFGTLADVEELIGQLHARGMKLVIDVVLNHTSDEHPWFVESRSSTDNPRRDWYWWAPPREGTVGGESGAEPTNWTSFFSPSVWEYDEATGEYYLHLFSRKQPDLNWENPAVRQELYAMLRWWLDRGVDGFRMDVINMISKVVPLKDGPPRPGGAYGDGFPEFINGPRVHEFLQELRREVIAGRAAPMSGSAPPPSHGTNWRTGADLGDNGLITVGETPATPIHEAVSYTDPANAEVDMIFQFEHMDLDHGPGGKFDVAPLRLRDLKASFGRWQTGLAERGWNSLYWDNHDQPRAVSRFGSDDPKWRELSAKLLGTVLHMHRGTPFVYQGEELGMTNVPFASLADVHDIESLNWHRAGTAMGLSEEVVLDGIRSRSRDNARSPMQWDASAQAGFTTGTPWFPVNPNHVEINVADQLDDPTSVLAHYRRLIGLRHELAVVAIGDFTMLLPDDEDVYAFTRGLGDDELLVLANFSDAERTVEVPGGTTELLLSNYPGDAGPIGTLRPWEATIHRRGGGAA